MYKHYILVVTFMVLLAFAGIDVGTGCEVLGPTPYGDAYLCW